MSKASETPIAESKTENDLLKDKLTATLSRLSAIQGFAIQKYRFDTTQLSTEHSYIDNLSLNLKAIESWLNIFPEGEAFEIAGNISKTDMPLLWVSSKNDDVKIIKGIVSGQSYAIENADGNNAVLKSGDLEKGIFIKMRPGESKSLVLGRKSPSSAFDWFIYAIFKRKTQFLEAILATLLISVLALAASFYSMQVYDRVIPTQNYSTLLVVTIGAFIAIFLELVSKELRSRIIDDACKFIDLELSAVFFDRMLSIRMDQRPKTIGTFASQVKQFELVRNFMTSSTLFVLADMPFVIFFILVIGYIGGIISIVPLALLPISIFVGFYTKWKIGHLADDQLAESNQKNGLLVEAIDGIEAIKSLGGEWKILEFWKSITEKSAEKEVRIRTVSSLATSITQTIQQVSFVSMIAVGAYAVTTGKITMGSLIACSIISNRALSPISQIAGKIIQWQHAKAALKGLDDMMKLATDRDKNVQMIIPESTNGLIKIEKASFSYDKNENAAIDEINLKINPSERIAIIGSVGSGKSSLIKMLSGLYKPTKGSVYLDEVSMDQIAPEYLREKIGYLTQDVRLFNGSLRYNLTMGLPNPRDSDILKACSETGLIHIIKNHPRGLELPIYEGGRGLSGGQKQLVGLTRMLIAKPKILLLDEPTASMDGDLEMHVMKSIFSNSDPYSIIILSSHKLGLLSFVDRIIVMDKGKIRFDGPKDVVLEKLKAASVKRTAPIQKA